MSDYQVPALLAMVDSGVVPRVPGRHSKLQGYHRFERRLARWLYKEYGNEYLKKCKQSMAREQNLIMDENNEDFADYPPVDSYIDINNVY